jgi:uncharacterized protein involved in exopolysaccharide biosynthesis
MQQLPPQGRSTADLRQITEEIYSFLGTVRRGWRLVGAALAIALTVATIYIARLKTTYQASARIHVLQQGGHPVHLGTAADAITQASGREDILATHPIIIRSPLIIQRALADAKLHTLSLGAVASGLKVTRPVENATILTLEYQGESAEQAEAVLNAIIQAYEGYLTDNYQKNSSEVIGLITRRGTNCPRTWPSWSRSTSSFARPTPG